MSVKIRLRRMGAKKQPSYRLVAADEQAPRDGRFLEIVGHYNPLTEPATINVKEDRVLFWLNNGATPSEAAAKILAKTSVMERWGGRKAKSNTKTEQPEDTEGQA